MVASRLQRAFGFALILMIMSSGSIQETSAGFIASNLGSGGTFNQLGGYSLAGPDGASSLGDSLAVQFQVSGTSSLVFGAAELALQYHYGINEIQVLLMSDAGGTPGAVLDTMEVSNLPVNPSLVTVTATDPILLSPGTNYWLAAVASGDSYLTWMMNDQGQSGHLAYQMIQNGVSLGWLTSPGSPYLAFQIDGVAAPPSVVLFAFGLSTVGLFSFGSRKLRRLVRAVNRGRRRRTIYRFFY